MAKRMISKIDYIILSAKIEKIEDEMEGLNMYDSRDAYRIGELQEKALDLLIEIEGCADPTYQERLNKLRLIKGGKA